MIKVVQATLLHVNSTDEQPYLCPDTDDTWCKYHLAKAKGEVYNTIPPAIIQLLRPIYAWLHSRSLLEKSVDGYTQNVNESLSLGFLS